MTIELNTIADAIEDIKNGKMVIVVDNENRENEGDLLMAADKVTAESINFMATYGRGLICCPITNEIAGRLELEPMVKQNTSEHHTAFTISVDLHNGSTGISAKDRALTISKIADPNSTYSDFVRPGHVFPLIAKDGGVLVRDGHTEAAVDLSRLAGFNPVGVICEIMSDDGTMRRGLDLVNFAEEHHLKIVSIKDLIKFRKENDFIYSTDDAVDFPNKYGNFKIKVFESLINKGEHHVAIFKGDITTDEPVLCRIHSECFTGDLFGSCRCECGDQLAQAMNAIEKNGRGLLLYMRQEGRGIGLPNKIKAYALQDKGMDTVDANIALGFAADLRNYSFAALMMKNLGVTKVRLITNNPDKVKGVEENGIEVVERVPTGVFVTEKNRHYLEVKRDRMGHVLSDKI